LACFGVNSAKVTKVSNHVRMMLTRSTLFHHHFSTSRNEPNYTLIVVVVKCVGAVGECEASGRVARCLLSWSESSPQVVVPSATAATTAAVVVVCKEAPPEHDHYRSRRCCRCRREGECQGERHTATGLLKAKVSESRSGWNRALFGSCEA
jgi:hypothetical protein